MRLLSKYTDFVDVFFLNLVTKLLKLTRINNYPIDLVENKQPSYGTIYSLRLMKSETLKTYSKTNLANNIIRFSKSLANTFIFFVLKPNKNL